MTVQLFAYSVSDVRSQKSVGLAVEEQSADAEGTRKIAKRSVSVKTVDKWKAENDKALSTSLWLQYNKSME